MGFHEKKFIKLICIFDILIGFDDDHWQWQQILDFIRIVFVLHSRGKKKPTKSNERYGNFDKNMNIEKSLNGNFYLVHCRSVCIVDASCCDNGCK